MDILVFIAIMAALTVLAIPLTLQGIARIIIARKASQALAERVVSSRCDEPRTGFAMITLQGIDESEEGGEQAWKR